MMLGQKDVPHYEQQFDYTCGPACLMMIFKHYDSGFQMDKKNEMDIWRESSLAPMPPTGRYGLAFAALRRGFSVKILANVKGMEYVEKTPRRLVGGDGRARMMKMLGALMEAQFSERRERAVELGLKEKKVGRIRTADVEGELKDGGIPILLTSARFFEDEDWAHWVVVTGTDERKVYVNDPASPQHKGRRVFSRSEFEKINGYYGDQVMISVKRP